MSLFSRYIKGEIPFDTISETLDGIDDEKKRIYEARWSIMHSIRTWRNFPTSEEENERFVELAQKMVQRFGPDFFMTTTTGDAEPIMSKIMHDEILGLDNDPDDPFYNPFRAAYEENYEEIQNPPVVMTKSSNKEGDYSNNDVIKSALLITKGDHNAAARLIINRMKT